MVNMILYPTYDSDFLSEEMKDALLERTLIHYASQLLEKALKDSGDLDAALHKSITALTAAGLPANRHFRKVYMCDETGIKTDWLVSDLGLRMILVNADVSNPFVAQLQVTLLSRPADF